MHILDPQLVLSNLVQDLYTIIFWNSLAYGIWDNLVVYFT